MSGNKMTDTKISQDLGDSGFHSGVQVLYPGDEDSGELRPESKETEPEKAVPRARDDNKVSSDSQSLNVDSGMVDYVSGDLSAELVRIDLKTETDSAKTDKLSQSLNVDSGIVDYVSGDLSPEVVCIDLKSGNDSAKTVRPPALGLPLEFLFQQDDDGDTQLHIAAYHGYEKPVSTLLRVCPNKELLNVCNDYGQTALHLAVLSQNPVITRMLVLAGADIGIRDRRGETPLHKAAALSAVKCIQALLMPVHGHPQRKNTAVLNQKNYSGQACVHVAATLGHIDSLQTLLFYRVDINSRENLAGWTALHIAASRGDTRMVQYLQHCGAVDARARDYAGRTPRRLARANRAASLFAKHDDSDTDSESEDDDDIFDEVFQNVLPKHSTKNQSIVA